MTHSVLLFLDPLTPPRFQCTYRHQHLFSLVLWPPCWPNQSGNIRCSTHIPLLLGFWIPLLLSSSISDSLSASQTSSLLFGLSKSTFQSSQCLVSETLSGALSSSLLAGWRSIYLIQQTFNTCVPPAGRCFADKADGTGNLSDDLNAAAPSCWMFDPDALTISSESEMYLTAVICLFWVQQSFCVVRRFWLPCHISKELWTLAILCNFFSTASLFISKSCSVFVVSTGGLLPASNLLLARANCLTTICSQRV